VKIVVFTYDRVKDASTPNMLEAAGADYLVVCHSEERRREYLENGTVASTKRIVSSNVPMGLANNRNWYIDHKLRDGEWCLMLVDDWIQAYELIGYDERAKIGDLGITLKTASSFNHDFKHKIDFARFYHHVEHLRSRLEHLRIETGGFAGYENPLFRSKQWRRNVLIDGRALVMKRTHARFDPNVQMVDDVAWSALNIFGGSGTLVNQWVLPDCKRYTAGAFGTIPERLARKKTECAYLVSAYTGLVRYAKKPGWPAFTHVKIAPAKPGRLGALRAAANRASPGP
jgi:hypothetical protein